NRLGSKVVRLRTSKCFPACPQSGRVVNPRTLASLQPRSRVALDRSRSCDRALAMQLGNALLGFPSQRLNVGSQLMQRRKDTVAMALNLDQLGSESVTLSG